MFDFVHNEAIDLMGAETLAQVYIALHTKYMEYCTKSHEYWDRYTSAENEYEKEFCKGVCDELDDNAKREQKIMADIESSISNDDIRTEDEFEKFEAILAEVGVKF